MNRKRAARWVVGLGLALLLTAVIIWLLIWYGPDVIGRHDVGSVTGSLRVLRLQQARDAARGHLLTLGAGLFAAGALLFTAQNFRVSRQTLEVALQGQMTDRFTKAIDQLGSDKMFVRAGGVYALGRIAYDSLRDQRVVMEVLCSFVREHSREPWPLPEPDNPNPERMTRPDVQAAISMIGQPSFHYDSRGIGLRGVDLSGADFSDLYFNKVSFYRANLTRADFSGAYLAGTDLSYADLTGATLAGANFFEADLTGATLHMADLTHVILSGANLSEADLTNADLSGANLTGANLSHVDLAGAKFPGRFDSAK